MNVRDLMTHEVVTLKRNDELSLAGDLMHLGRIRHLPVLDEETGELAGIVSERDLFRGALVSVLGFGKVAQRRISKTISVKEVMSTDVVTIGGDVALREAAEQMLERKIGCLPVVEGEKLIGILTESDFVSLVARGKVES